MRIPIFSFDANPAVDREFLRKSRHYCAEEVQKGRARELKPGNLMAGIQLLPPDEIVSKARARTEERRGSAEAQGCLTAHESLLNADYGGVSTEIDDLVREYEVRLEKAVQRAAQEGRMIAPRALAVIAARVKTILSNPARSEVQQRALA